MAGPAGDNFLREHSAAGSREKGTEDYPGTLGVEQSYYKALIAAGVLEWIESDQSNALYVVSRRQPEIFGQADQLFRAVGVLFDRVDVVIQSVFEIRVFEPLRKSVEQVPEAGDSPL